MWITRASLNVVIVISPCTQTYTKMLTLTHTHTYRLMQRFKHFYTIDSLYRYSFLNFIVTTAKILQLLHVRPIWNWKWNSNRTQLWNCFKTNSSSNICIKVCIRGGKKQQNQKKKKKDRDTKKKRLVLEEIGNKWKYWLVVGFFMYRV